MRARKPPVLFVSDYEKKNEVLYDNARAVFLAVSPGSRSRTRPRLYEQHTFFPEAARRSLRGGVFHTGEWCFRCVSPALLWGANVFFFSVVRCVEIFLWDGC